MTNTKFFALVFVSCSFLSSSLSGQTGWQWAKNIFCSTFEYQQSVCRIVTDPWGNVFVGSDCFYCTGLMANDLFLYKYNAGGSLIWEKHSSNSGFYVKSMTSDVFGNIYVTGFNEGFYWYSDSAAGSGLLVLKFDNAGDLIWSRSGIGGMPSGICVDQSQNVYVTGSFSDSVMTVSPYTLVNNSTLYDADIFIVKFDSSGILKWAKSAGGPLNDYATTTAVDNFGGVYIAGGYNSSNLTFGTTNLVGSGSGNAFIAKFDTSGNEIWAKTSVNSGSCNATAMATDIEGNIYIDGNFTMDSFQSLAFGSTLLYGPFFNYAEGGIFLVKYDSSGNSIWGVSDTCAQLTALATDKPGNVYIGGYFSYPSFSYLSLSQLNCAPYYSNTLLMEFSPSGNALWMQTNSGSGYSTTDHGTIVTNDEIQGISIDSLGRVFIAGQFMSNTMTFGSYTISTGGYSDIFVAELDDSLLAVPFIGAAQKSVSVYPNPANNYVDISLAGLQNVNNVVITDENGKIVFEDHSPSQTTWGKSIIVHIAIPESVVDGIYGVKLVSSAGYASGRFLRLR